MRDFADFEIRTLEDGKRIEEPGFYRIPMDRHHNQPCDGPSVTSSILRKIEKSTPADVWAFHALNPDRFEMEERDCLREGRAIAALIEGGVDELNKHFMTLPDDKPRRPTEAQLRAIKEGRATDAGLRSFAYWKEVDKDPRTKLTAAQWNTIVAMGLQLSKDSAAKAFLGGEPEITMAWYDEANNIWCLSRPDQISMSGMLTDFKKFNPQGRSVSPGLIDRLIENNGYDMQMGFAAEGWETLTGTWPSAVGLLFEADTPPYHTVPRALDDETLEEAIFMNRDARRVFRECMDSGVWPGPGDTIGTFKRSERGRDYIRERMSIAGQ